MDIDFLKYKDVSILVIMDSAQKVFLGRPAKVRGAVSILVIMDSAQKDYEKIYYSILKYVSILVIMDSAQKAATARSLDGLKERFNPCYNG